MTKVTMTAGLAIRRQVRRQLMEAGISFQEEKGFLNSLFIIDATDAQAEALEWWVIQVNAPRT